jgi:hypothetical protein
MNPEEIRNMPIGKEIDELIQICVFGKPVQAFCNETPCPYCGRKMRFCGQRSWCGECRKWRYSSVKNYSADITFAWEVVEKIKSWGEGWCPQIYWDDNDGLEPGDWVVEFNKYWKLKNDYRHCEAIADTAPLAICRAALVAVNERTDE